MIGVMKQGLGTQLRHLIELLDSAVEDAYVKAQIPGYRPRYTPVMRVLAERQPVTIGEIAEVAGITQPAATQTVALMQKNHLLIIEPGPIDARQRMVSLSEKGRQLLPQLEQCWRATKLAADSLDDDLDVPLSSSLRKAIEALKARPFGDRIHAARSAMAQDPDKPPAATSKKSKKKRTEQ